MPAILNTVVWPLILALKSHTNGLVLNYQNQSYLGSMLHVGNKTKTSYFAQAFGLSLKNDRHNYIDC